MTASPQPPPRFKTRNLLGVIVVLRKYPLWVALCLALLLLILSVDLALPQLIGDAITELREYMDEHIPFSPKLYVQIILSLVLIRTGLAYILGPIRNRTVQATLADIRAAIYNAMQRLPFAYHDKTNSGELISRSTADIFRLQDFFYACLFLSVDIGVSLVVTNVLIMRLSPALGCLALATMLPTIALIGFYASKLQPQWRNVHDLHGAMTTVIQENIAGVRVVKAFAKESAEVTKFRDRKDVFLGTLMKTVNYWATRVPFAQFIFGLSMPLILWVGGRQVIAGQMPIGDLAKVVFYLMAIGHRVGAVGQFTNILQTASASAERVLEILHEPQSIRTGKRGLPESGGEVRFENVSFNYTDGKASLTDVSFEAKPGQTIAIVGPTGSGKTTLVN